MSWKDRHKQPRAADVVHEYYRIPVMFTSDNCVTWRVVFCRFHEKINVEGLGIGSGSGDITVSASEPNAIFVASDVPDISSKGCFVSVSEGKSYKVAKAPAPDRMGYLTAKLESTPRNANSTVVYPVPDWDAL